MRARSPRAPQDPALPARALDAYSAFLDDLHQRGLQECTVWLEFNHLLTAAPMFLEAAGQVATRDLGFCWRTAHLGTEALLTLRQAFDALGADTDDLFGILRQGLKTHKQVLLQLIHALHPHVLASIAGELQPSLDRFSGVRLATLELSR